MVRWSPKGQRFAPEPLSIDPPSGNGSKSGEAGRLKIKCSRRVPSGTKLSFSLWIYASLIRLSFNARRSRCSLMAARSCSSTVKPVRGPHVSEVWKEFGIPDRCVVEAVVESDGSPSLLFRYQGDPIFILQPEKVDLLRQRLAEAGDSRQLARLDRIIRNARRWAKRPQRQFSIGDETKPSATK
jgi:hypothetical protein